MTTSRRYAHLGLFLLVALAFSFKEPEPKYDDDLFEISKNIDIFGKIIKEVKGNYVDDIEPNQFFKVGIDAMLASLDPYTNYISASEIEDFRFMSTGSYGGIGAGLIKREDKILISDVYQGKPADKAGIRSGDQVIQIDNEPIEGKNFDLADIRNLLRGAANTKVKLKIKPYNQAEPRTVEITREDVKMDNVPYYGMVSNDVGLITLRNFSKDAALEIKNAFQDLKKQQPNLKGLIINLKDNPGGLLLESVAIANLFVNKGEKVVETRGKIEGSYKQYAAEDNPIDTQIPIVCIVNKNSASASEIVSGVLQDLDRGVVVGQRSFGKGLVQTTRDLSYKTKLKITTARYYTPSGRCIQAIDYAHKGKDGTVKRTADSLKQTFKTKNGRIVRDQGGVEPDFALPEPEYHKVTQDLIRENLIFDFANAYRARNASLPSVKDFQISDALYAEFVSFVQSRQFKATARQDKKLEELDKELKKEAYYETVKGSVAALRAELERLSQSDIQAHKKEIQHVLRTEIVKRYYYEKGYQEASLAQDPEVQKAIEILNNPELYRQTLKGGYTSR
jgi:carboxyl-terminal processing protease